MWLVDGFGRKERAAMDVTGFTAILTKIVE
jgi:hypothetical protein